MATLTADNIVDIGKTTLKNLQRLNFTMIAMELQRYPALQQILNPKKVKLDGGDAHEWRVMVRHSDQAANVGLYEEDNVNVSDVWETASIPFRHTTTAWAFDRREKSFNSGPSQIVDLIKSRRIDGMLSLAELMEKNVWSKPSDSSDKKNPHGIPYWVVKYPDGTTTPGFTGGNPAGFTAGAGGLSSSTYGRWTNFAGQYTNIAKDDLIKSMREGAVKTVFESPVPYPAAKRGMDDKAIYVPYSVLSAIEILGEGQNENLGRDIASMDGKLVFRGTPFTWLPILDLDTDTPVYMINWAYLYPVFLKGNWMREDPPAKSPKSHNVFEAFVDLSWNICCKDRSRQVVLSKNNDYSLLAA